MPVCWQCLLVFTRRNIHGKKGKWKKWKKKKRWKQADRVGFSKCLQKYQAPDNLRGENLNHNRIKFLRKNIKIKIKQNKRGKRKNSKNFSKTLRFLGVNAAGLQSKILSFKKVLSELKPSVFFLEETKMKYEGKIRIENYLIFEKVRQKRSGRGIALGCIKDLNPIWVREGEGDLEALSVEISVRNMKIRCCVAYGYQENENIEKKNSFWKYLDEEVINA